MLLVVLLEGQVFGGVLKEQRRRRTSFLFFFLLLTLHWLEGLHIGVFLGVGRSVLTVGRVVLVAVALGLGVASSSPAGLLPFVGRLRVVYLQQLPILHDMSDRLNSIGYGYMRVCV